MMHTLICTLTLLIAMAFFTLIERKFLAYIQIRKGPNKPMFMGLPLPVADALKLFTKEPLTPMMANKSIFFMPPMVALLLAILLGNLTPTTAGSLHTDFTAIMFIIVMALNTYPLFATGWISNSKYALLGAMRAIAQVISYEVILSMCALSTLVIHQSLSLTSTFHTQAWPLLLMPLMTPIWIIIMLAETNRTPFDLAEGESELISGFNIEYSGAPFAFIFMAEYTSIIAMSMYTAAIFTSSTLNMTLTFKTLILIFTFIWVRGTLPRQRYDNLMYLMWFSLLPITLGMLTLLLTLFLL